MAYEARPWTRRTDLAASRRAHLAARGDYRASVPAEIAARTPELSGTCLALADDATRELTRFDAEAGHIAAPFDAILLRSESASSSEVENLTSSAQQVALAELGVSRSGNARLVVANAHAMRAAIALSERLDSDAIIAMHAALLNDSDPEAVGAWRHQQVWIGGGSVSPHTASFVPPHADRVHHLMADLVAFMHRTDLPVLVTAAIAHAQFETIHPFTDGNGRTGRALIHGLLRNMGATTNVTVPVSAGLLHDTSAYFAALDAYRDGRPEAIVESLAEASFRAVSNGRLLVADINAAARGWDNKVRARSDSSVHRLKSHLLSHPVVNVRSVANHLEVSDVAATSAISKLADAGVLTPLSDNRRNRLWRADDVLQALDAFGVRARRL